NPFKYLKPFFSELGDISFNSTINFENIRRFADHGEFFLFQKLLKHLERHTLIPESKFQQISFLKCLGGCKHHMGTHYFLCNRLQFPEPVFRKQDLPGNGKRSISYLGNITRIVRNHSYLVSLCS